MSPADRNKIAAAFGPTPDCTAIEDLAPALEGMRGEEVRQRTQAHVDQCAFCQTELALFRQFESPNIRPEERAAVASVTARLRRASPVRSPSLFDRFRRPAFLVPVCAGLAAAVVALVLLVPASRQTLAPYTPPEQEPLRSRAVDVIGPTGDLTAAPAEFQWQAVGGASAYRVRLMETDRTVLWHETVPGTSVTLPRAVRNRIVPLKTLLWDVAAVDAAGTVIAQSGIKRFKLIPAGQQ